MVHIFTADLSLTDLTSLEERYYDTLPLWRKEKTDQIRTEKGKMECIGAWALLMEAVRLLYEENSPFENVLANGVCFEDLDSAESFLAVPNINLSHSEKYVLCAISTKETAKVGCDIEKTGDLRLKLAKRFFCQEEYDHILATGQEEEQKTLFYRYWVLKEAFMKASREGMKRPMDSYLIDLKKADENQMDRGEYQILKSEGLDTEKTYTYREYEIQSGYRAAVCAVGDEISEEVRMICL